MISETIVRVDKVYFFDLIGRRRGMLLLGAFPERHRRAEYRHYCVRRIRRFLRDLVQSVGSSRGRMGGVALALLFVAFIVLNLKRPFIDVQFAKGQRLSNEMFVKWNPISRIALAPEKDSGMMLIFIDADASTGIANFDFSHLTDIAKEGSGVTRPRVRLSDSARAERLCDRPRRRAGTSREHSHPARKDITGVEINPIIANTIMRKKFPRPQPESLSAAGSPHRGGRRSGVSSGAVPKNTRFSRPRSSILGRQPPPERLRYRRTASTRPMRSTII